MAPVIWGLDLRELQWAKFKSSYMWNTDYHLRRTKFIVYQCALIFCVVSESLGTAALSDYLDARDLVKSQSQRDGNDVYVYNRDYIGVASYNIFAGIFVAFIFGAAFFFDLFWPERSENRAVRLAWKVCSVLAVLLYTADAFALTVITAVRCQRFSGRGAERGPEYLSRFHKDGGEPICYRQNGRAIAAVVFVWPGLLSVIGSAVLMFFSIDNTEKGPGPKSKHARERDGEKATRNSVEKDEESPSFELQEPEQAHKSDREAMSGGTASAAVY